MRVRPYELIRATLLALSLPGGPTAMASEGTPYSIWWSPTLELESLQLIDQKLQDELPQARRFHVVKFDMKFTYTDTLVDEFDPERGHVTTWEHENEQVLLIKNCLAMMEWSNKGFNPDEFDDHRIFNGWTAYCYALNALKTVKPARRSFVDTFSFDNRTMNYLPAMVVQSWGCRGLKELLEANRQYVPWIEFDHGWVKNPTYYRLIVESPNAIVMEESLLGTPDEVVVEYLIEILGRGDFDGDGLEDLVIKREYHDFISGGRATTLYLVTRRGEDEVLRVVDFFGPMPMGSCSPRKAIIRSGQEP